MEDSSIIIYRTEDGTIKIEACSEDESVWLTIEQMAELFSKSRSAINEHILNIYKENELIKDNFSRKIGISDFSHRTIIVKLFLFVNIYCL